MPAWLQAVLTWVEMNPTWAGVVVFTVAMAESLLIVGVLVPGAALMLGIGALVALGGLDLLTVLLWAIAGAVVGDGISFWIGYIYRDRLRTMWPFATRPHILARGEAFFLKHGGKSVAIGRFVGPIRAIIPTVAGIMGMSPLRFTLVNVLSAIAWAPAYILPGMVIGTSLGLASQVAARLGILLVIVLVGAWLVVWGMRAAFNFYQPRAAAIIERWLNWGRSHPRMGRLATALLDPARPEASALTALAMMLIFSAWLFFTLLIFVVGEETVAQVDEATYEIMASLRSAWADEFMVTLSQLGDGQVTVPLTLGVAAWLASRRLWLAAGHWLGAVGFAAIVTVLLKEALAVPRPEAIYSGLVEFAFPSGHVAIATVMYGFAAVLLSHALPPTRRWIPSAVAGVIIGAIALSRLYLGAHWLSDVIGGLALGLIWVALLGIGYRRHASHPVPVASTGLVMVALLTGMGSFHVLNHHERELARYLPTPTPALLSGESWWNHAWQSLPPFRVDMQGLALQPLNVQWAGRLDDIRPLLLGEGWIDAEPFTFAQALLTLSPQADVGALPILPLSHDGRHDALTMVKRGTEGESHRILRLWPADVQLDEGSPLWLGFVSNLEIAKLPLVTYVRSTKDFAAALVALPTGLADLQTRQVTRSPAPPTHEDFAGAWNGELVLLRNP